MRGTLTRRLRRHLSARLPVELLVSVSALWHGETAAQRRVACWVHGAGCRLPQRTPPAGQDTPGASTADHPVGRFSAVETLADALGLVVDALEAEGVPPWVLEAATARRGVVVVLGDDAARARAALAGHLTDRRVHVCRVTGGRPGGKAVPAGAVAADRSLASASVLRVFESIEVDGQRLAGAELGCDLEVWRVLPADQEVPGSDGYRHAGGTALAPRGNRWTTHLTVEQRRPVRAEAFGRQVTTCAGLLRPHLFDVRFPVDVVYTWVDGSDPVWQERRAAFLGERPDPVNPLAANPGRYTCHDELRYSLRSLEMYAGWVRNVYLVTDGQVPEWLATDHPRLCVVDHREIFAPDALDALPTFNSHAIESRLHHIDGLAEHFLYLNDDVFFGRAVAPELFFLGSGQTRFVLSPNTIDLAPAGDPLDPPVVSAAKNNRALVEETFGATITQKLKHVAHPQRRSVLLELESRFPEAFARTSRSHLRDRRDVSVPSALAHYYGFATGRAVPGGLAYRYCDVAARRTPLTLQRLLRHRDADVFCLNETASRDPDAVAELVQPFLDAYFPLPSSFETRPVPVPGPPRPT